MLGAGFDWSGLTTAIVGGVSAERQKKADAALMAQQIKLQNAANRAGAGGAAPGGMGMTTMLMIGGGVAVVGLVLKRR